MRNAIKWYRLNFLEVTFTSFYRLIAFFIGFDCFLAIFGGFLVFYKNYKIQDGVSKDGDCSKQ